MEDQEQKYVITVEVAQAIFQYLSTRPHSEVDNLIVALKSGEVLESEESKQED